jgi:hypothetical protein
VELYDPYIHGLFHQIKNEKMGGPCGTYGGQEWVLVGRHEGKRPLGKPTATYEDNIKMDSLDV